MAEENESSSHSQLGIHFIKLPRELRDLVYFYAIQGDIITPLEIADINNHIPLTDTTLHHEFLEALYTHRTIQVTFTAPELLRDAPTPPNIWGPYPQHKNRIRHLIITTPEAHFQSHNLSTLEHSCNLQPEMRVQWLSLLNLPRLESLTIEMQKTLFSGFVWADFTPILFHLRHTLPKLNLTFKLSFDALLKAKWEVLSLLDPVNGGWTLQTDPYLPMGYVDATELIEAPSEQDRAYVREHIEEGSTDVGVRDACRGLLDETPESRRALAVHYVVKEPELLRCLMEEHWGIWKRERSGGGE